MAPIDQKDKLNNINRLLSRQRLEKMRPEQSADRTTGKDKSSSVIDDGYVQSSRGIEINAIKERVNQLPEVDMQKVERLKQQIAGGVYQVSSEILAENILAASVDGNQDGELCVCDLSIRHSNTFDLNKGAKFMKGGTT